MTTTLKKKKKTKGPPAPSAPVELMCASREAEFATMIPVGQSPTVRLEARVANQVTGEVAVIFCPALPPAGNMYIPEIGYIQAKLALRGYVTVRFNFRGVGASEGGSNFFFRSARTEMEDVRDVARWLARNRAHFKLPALRACWLVGVSYGSVIGAAAAHFEEFDGYVAVSYPSNYLWYCTGFDSTAFFDLAKCAKPKLFVWGDTDVFAGKSAMDKAFEELPEPKAKKVIDELDSVLGHYFRSKRHLDALDDAVNAFLTSHNDDDDKEDEDDDKEDDDDAAKTKTNRRRVPPETRVAAEPPPPAAAAGKKKKKKKKKFGGFF